MPRIVNAALGALMLAAVVGVPVVYRSHMSTKYRNFRVVEPGVLYRSGQMSVEGLASTVAQYGVKTVVTLRDARDDGRKPDTAEDDWCASHGVKHVTLSPANWHDDAGGTPPVQENVTEFLKIVDDPKNRPVLVHCFAGIHRTGGYVSVFRMEYDGWQPAEAIDEMESMGTARTVFDDEIRGYLRQYTPRARCPLGE